MLTNAEKKTLRGIAQNQRALCMVGKDGVTYNVIKDVQTALEAHELVKVSLLKTCPASIKEVALDLSAATRSEIVHTIGRVVILYKRSKENKLGL